LDRRRRNHPRAESQGPSARWCLGLRARQAPAGQLNGATLGLNWYLNPHCRMTFNYDYVYRSHNQDPLAHGALHSFGSRMSLDF